MPQCALSLGTNLGDGSKNLENALSSVSRLPKTELLRTSCVYKTPAWGVTDQPDFLNCCALIETMLSPSAVLGCCLGIEAAMGRKRLRKWGERIIDIDLLCYEGCALQTEELWLPHKYMLSRAFVLLPLMDIFPDGECMGIDIKSPLKTMDISGIEQVRSVF